MGSFRAELDRPNKTLWLKGSKARTWFRVMDLVESSKIRGEMRLRIQRSSEDVTNWEIQQ